MPSRVPSGSANLPCLTRVRELGPLGLLRVLRVRLHLCLALQLRIKTGRINNRKCTRCEPAFPFQGLFCILANLAGTRERVQQDSGGRFGLVPRSNLSHGMVHLPTCELTLGLEADIASFLRINVASCRSCRRTGCPQLLVQLTNRWEMYGSCRILMPSNL